MKYGDWAPTEFDVKGMGMHDRQEWDVAPCILTRDSDRRERRRFESFRKRLGVDSENSEEHAFNHWGCGWFRIIIVRPGTPQALNVERAVARMEKAGR